MKRHTVFVIAGMSVPSLVLFALIIILAPHTHHPWQVPLAFYCFSLFLLGLAREVGHESQRRAMEEQCRFGEVEQLSELERVGHNEKSPSTIIADFRGFLEDVNPEDFGRFDC